MSEIAVSPQSFLTMLHDGGVSIEAIAAHLDALDHQGRLDALFAMRRADQRALYEKAAAAPPIDVSFFSTGGPVTHHGKNSLPVPTVFRRFAKVFAAADGARLFGFNEGVLRPYIGPGYFVAYSTAGKPEWQARGGVVVDYFQVPDGPVPAGWPGVVPNSKGLQVLVYHHTRDFMRRVSAQVSIGAAYKEERAMGQFFVLCKEPGR
jgi:hypothetical protein